MYTVMRATSVTSRKLSGADFSYVGIGCHANACTGLGIKETDFVINDRSILNKYFINDGRLLELNNLDNQVFPLSLSFSDKTKLAPLNMISTEYGSSQNEFDYEKNDQGETADFIFKQASMGFTVDDFIKIYNPPLPNHLKIDVDGIENLIVKGASTLLSHKNLNDISIEINEKNQNAYQSITKILESFNFSLTHKKHSPIFDLIPDYSIYNFIFSRTTA